MGQVIVVEFVTLDGVVEDPDGTAGLPGGGWAFHAGPEVFAGDKFELGPIMEHGVLLFGRKLPDIGRSLGKTVTEFKKGFTGLEEEVHTGARPAAVEPEAVKPPQRGTPTAAAPKFEDAASNLPPTV